MAGRVEVGPFVVDDLSYDDAVEAAVALATADRDVPSRAYALHVGGLNHRRDSNFVAEMASAELVYADGGSVVLLAKLAGADQVERAPTTDLGWSILRALGDRLGRPTRIALIGGPPGLAERAGAALTEGGAGTIVFTADGYQEDWTPVLAELVAAEPDVCVVGMGAPREMLWVRQLVRPAATRAGADLRGLVRLPGRGGAAGHRRPAPARAGVDRPRRSVAAAARGQVRSWGGIHRRAGGANGGAGGQEPVAEMNKSLSGEWSPSWPRRRPPSPSLAAANPGSRPGCRATRPGRPTPSNRSCR